MHLDYFYKRRIGNAVRICLVASDVRPAAGSMTGIVPTIDPSQYWDAGHLLSDAWSALCCTYTVAIYWNVGHLLGPDAAVDFTVDILHDGDKGWSEEPS